MSWTHNHSVMGERSESVRYEHTLTPLLYGLEKKMITLRVKIVEYDKVKNTCYAELLNGDKIELDPFVGCAIQMDDVDYENNKGFELEGKEFILTEYSVYKHIVVPSEGGMIAL